MELNNMRVTKRNGELEEIFFDKILLRVKKLCVEANITTINHASLVIKVIDQLYDKIPTKKIDELTAEQCASLSTQHPDYNTLAGRIIVSNHHKNTNNKFSEVMKSLYYYVNPINNTASPIVSDKLWDIVSNNVDLFDKLIVNDRDYLIDYFGFKTLEKAYLFKVGESIVERPQYMWLRVSIGIHGNNIKNIIETYNYLSLKYFTHATPTLFNAGTPTPQLSSCYLIAMESDSIDGIYNTLKDCAQISKYSGGIGIHIHNIRCKGSFISGTNGKTDGIVPMIRVFNSTARYVNQSGKRNGSIAVYLEPWHADIESFLDLKKNHGDEEMRARDLFYALWICDLFMERIKRNGKWTLFCPNECKELFNVYGDEFNTLYEEYETAGKGRKTINARDLWFNILDSQMETGTPYLLYKDAANFKSNQKNLGTIKSSNLCTEIIEYSDENETAVCNLASIALPTFVDEKTKTFDYEKLHTVAKVVTSNLNKVIDVNFYPTEKAKRSNLSHRPIGIGIQGLADVFIMMDLPFYSDEAKQININIFETLYHASLERSNEIAIDRFNKLHNFHEYLNKMSLLEYDNELDNISSVYSKDFIEEFTNLETGEKEILNYLELEKLPNFCCGAYSSFIGSPMASGVFQFDLWGVSPSERYDWNKLKESVIKYGIRNSLLIAPMPTASTSQILGFNECFEPITSNIYSRSTIAGEFVMANKYLMKELIQLGLWNDKIKNNIILNKGSIQHLTVIPENIRNKYKIVWEIPMKHIIDMSADRGAYICQSQSLNLWLEDPNYSTLTSMHFYAWKKGLKTGIYYLRRKAKHQAQQFSIEPEARQNNNEYKDDICDMCSA
jgi:ribonucleoside-diphosphate reductase alpha subunit